MRIEKLQLAKTNFKNKSNNYERKNHTCKLDTEVIEHEIQTLDAFLRKNSKVLKDIKSEAREEGGYIKHLR